MPIINSLLDTDLYKFTQGQVAFHQFNELNVKYKFKCRNNIKFTQDMYNRIHEELMHWTTLRFGYQDIDFLRKTGYFKETYLQFLKEYKPHMPHLKMNLNDETGELSMEVEGPWYQTIFWEVPLLAIVSEIYSETFPIAENPDVIHCSTLDELEKFKELDKNIKFADFGTRRRFSYTHHRNVIEELASNIVGTSNVHFAKEFGLKPIGTMAHEFFQVGQAVAPLHKFQSHMLQCWVDEYRGDLGIALTDIVGIDAFLKEFDLYFSKLYDGVRHDSGCPYEWAKKMIVHYHRLGIEPNDKQLVFSDGLDVEEIQRLHLFMRTQNGVSEPNVSFGIGTNLTNNVPYYREQGFKPPQIVMKIVEADGVPVAKLSDSPGKGMCEDPTYLEYLKKLYNR